MEIMQPQRSAGRMERLYCERLLHRSLLHVRNSPNLHVSREVYSHDSNDLIFPIYKIKVSEYHMKYCDKELEIMMKGL